LNTKTAKSYQIQPFPTHGSQTFKSSGVHRKVGTVGSIPMHLRHYFSAITQLLLGDDNCCSSQECNLRTSPQKELPQPQLVRALGLREGIAIQIGMIIGSGIFVVPATIAGHLPAFGPILLVWVLGGLLILFGALSLAELSSVLPQAGGPYVYLREGFGPVWAFMFTWNHYFINTAGSIAAIAVAFATYLGSFIPALSPQNSFFVKNWVWFGRPMSFSVGWVQIAAMMVIALVTFINVRGVKLGGWVMDLFTTAKVAALMALILAVAFSGKGSVSNMLPLWPEHWTSDFSAGFGLAMISVLWAYDGWITVTLTAGEMKNPQRNIPRSLIAGTLAVIGIYVAANLAYAYVIPLRAMPGSPRIAADAARTVLGPAGALIIVAGILCSAFGTIHGCVLGGPRCIYAAGTDRTFAPGFGKVHPRFHTPAVAIITLGVWGALLTLSGTYEQITSYVVFGSWAFYALTALSVIALRVKMPDAPRPYKAWGYPTTTLLFVAVTCWFLMNTLIRDPRNAIIGIALLLLALPFYFHWRRQSHVRLRRMR
jgi:basic amino acid/polyamine antiporter, APA family